MIRSVQIQSVFFFAQSHQKYHLRRQFNQFSTDFQNLKHKSFEILIFEVKNPPKGKIDCLPFQEFPLGQSTVWLRNFLAKGLLSCERNVLESHCSERERQFPFYLLAIAKLISISLCGNGFLQWSTNYLSRIILQLITFYTEGVVLSINSKTDLISWNVYMVHCMNVI